MLIFILRVFSSAVLRFDYSNHSQEAFAFRRPVSKKQFQASRPPEKNTTDKNISCNATAIILKSLLYLYPCYIPVIFISYLTCNSVFGFAFYLFIEIILLTMKLNCQVIVFMTESLIHSLERFLCCPEMCINSTSDLFGIIFIVKINQKQTIFQL